MLIKVFSVSVKRKLSSPGVLEEEGGGGQQASCLVAKQAVEFPQVLASFYNFRCSQQTLLCKNC